MRPTAKTNQPPWFISHPELSACIRLCADELNNACLMHTLAERTQTDLEIQVCSLRKNVLLEKFEAYAEAIEAFTGTRYSFYRTDTHYGICDEEDNPLYLVSREPWVLPQQDKK